MFGLRTTHLLPAAVATLALALTGCGAHDDTGSATDPATSQAPASSAEPGSTLALTADGSAGGTRVSPEQDLQDLLMAVDFQQGTSYLVSATDGRVTLCGYTAEANADLQAIYDEAFAQ